jgi:Dna[CI] antecedent, DciA
VPTPEEPPGPRHVSWSLRQLASRVRRVDLVGFGAVESAWPSVGSATASGAVPVRLANGELTVAVASGAHAARARRDAAAMLAELGTLLEVPPTSVRVAVRT